MSSGQKIHRSDGRSLRADRSGVVGLLLWGDDVERIRPGHAVRLERGWCRARDGALVVSTGRHGRLRLMEPTSTH